MVYCEKTKLDPVALQLYDYLLSSAPLDCLEATEQYWIDDLYFIANADLPPRLHLDRILVFNYTDQ